MCICFDETGSNISIKSEGHVGGKKYVCAAVTTPQRKLYKTEGQFTTLAVTAFNGESVMSVVIIMDKHEKAEVESGIEIFAELI